ncbi:nuclear transport factor 2 family protein [Arthrobacter sp. CDRTa11]|uniref:nuclear transport factor 2 family protein n=1 Tax=Arthrobacter sp. CDRTa11 TaxID=2651199 RepID=UPI002265CDCE|nr:nuclear transport factor 2 family protein [Arthrobacter sp. CDRTa11]UZX01262.1 nuclear transport factor 2 family protein [Arthrobacter sp. CDRTa11]
MDNATAAEKNKIETLEAKRYQAVVDGDYDAFEGLCHQRLVYTHSLGDRDTLGSYLEKLRKGFYRYHRIDHPIEDIVLIGDTALVLGQMNADLTVNGTHKTLANSALSVWIKEGESWKFLAYQPTPRKPAAA